MWFCGFGYYSHRVIITGRVMVVFNCTNWPMAFLGKVLNNKIFKYTKKI